VDETADTATETEMDEMADTEVAHAMTIHGRDSMKAMATKRILAKFEGTRCSEASFGLSCGGFLDLQSFFPSTPGVSGSSIHKVITKVVFALA